MSEIKLNSPESIKSAEIHERLVTIEEATELALRSNIEV